MRGLWCDVIYLTIQSMPVGAKLPRVEETTTNGNSDPQENVKGARNNKKARRTKAINTILVFLSSLSFLEVIKAY